VEAEREGSEVREIDGFDFDVEIVDSMPLRILLDVML
jgi:hypothetical protein